MIVKQQVKTIGIADAPALRVLLGSPTAGICDHSIGNLYMWKDPLATARIGEDKLCLAEHYEGNTHFSLRLSDGDYATRIADLLTQFGTPLYLCSMQEEEVAALRELYGDRFTAEGADGAADYIYDAASLRTFAGRKFHAQKNHMNAFLRAYVDYEFLPCSDPAHLTAFLDEYETAVIDETESAKQESLACRRLFAMLPDLDLDTRILRVGGKTVGICIMERVGDTLMIHVEKGLPAYRGVYPMLVHLEACAYPDVRLINREEDDGNEGLRRSKRSYHPVMLKQKYIGKIE